jgi:phospholipid/cholesterol/gamma-HCH transport system ATP-binding protein
LSAVPAAGERRGPLAERAPAPAGAGATILAPPDPVKIRLRDVHKRFGDKVVLDGLDLDVLAGESLVVIGGSGTGKSVLLKHVIGLIRPDSGSVEVDGVRIDQLGYREITGFRRRFGMAFQEGALFDSMSVRDNVAFPLRRAKRPRQEIADRVDECLRLVKLEDAGHKMPSELSGGMRRRVGFARAIALEPQILLFDEPTTGLDPVIKAVIDELIMSLQETLDSTVITITHDMKSAFRTADRIGMLHHGKVVAIASPEDFQRLEDPRVQQFLRGDAHGPLSEEPDQARRWRL